MSMIYPMISLGCFMSHRQNISMLLTRVFNHPRYVAFILTTIVATLFFTHGVVAILLGFIFLFEVSLRIWLHRSSGWDNHWETFFIVLDVIATLSLFAAALIPEINSEYGAALRIIRVIRSLTILKTMRVFVS